MSVASPPTNNAAVPDNATYATALKTLNIPALEKDLLAFMTTSDQCWPSDGGNYGGLMIRLAWHCSGTFRKDGRGGCSGGRLRFEPERSWMDNANLDKARALLGDIKKKYGDALSWGDLMSYAGTVAIRSMGGPTDPHCFGRIDEANGAKSEIFGTTAKFSDTGCKFNGNCTLPLGAITVGLIYVNPEGPLNAAGTGQDPDPAKSAIEIREVFKRMGMNDSETAALIVGGHAFGQCHAVTSGFEGPWTTTPSKWSNEFLTAMLDNNVTWVKKTNAQGTVQWMTTNSKFAGTMRLTSDLALVNDATYKALAIEWVNKPRKLEDDFAAAWDKLMIQGSSWSSAKKCEANLPARPISETANQTTLSDMSMNIGLPVLAFAAIFLILPL